MKGRLGSEGEVAKHSPLTQVQSAQDEDADEMSPESEDDGGSDIGSPEGERVMKSPELQDVDSPVLSGEEEFPDDEPDSPEMTAKKPVMVETGGGTAVLRDDDGGAPLDETSKHA